MLRKRNFQVEQYVIMDPAANSYQRDVVTNVYKMGNVEGFEGKTTVIASGAENLDVFVESFDTLMMVNVLEHVQNGIRSLRNVWNALKPGGLIIFNDRWLDHEGAAGEVRSLMGLDVLFHPVR